MDVWTPASHVLDGGTEVILRHDPVVRHPRTGTLTHRTRVLEMDCRATAAIRSAKSWAFYFRKFLYRLFVVLADFRASYRTICDSTLPRSSDSLGFLPPCESIVDSGPGPFPQPSDLIVHALTTPAATEALACTGNWGNSKASVGRFSGLTTLPP